MHTSRGHETEEEARFELTELELDLKKGTYKKRKRQLLPMYSATGESV